MKIVVLAGYDSSLCNFRGALLRSMVAAGHEVIGAAPKETPGVSKRLAEMNVRFVPTKLSRAGLNPWADALSLRRLRKFFKQERPDIVLSYTIKPVIYGSFGARAAGVPHIYALITGLGAAFNSRQVKGRLLRLVAVRMYRAALARCEKVFVQNREISDLFIRERMARPEQVVVVRGSGVDVRHFAFSPTPEGPPVFLFLGRLLRDKGVGELIDAARLVRRKLPQARFVLVGETDANPTSFSGAEVESWQRDGIVEHFCVQEDVRPFLQRSTVLVLPSYHEGLPRSVLEGMATGRAIITTDTIGCRETVIDAKSVAGDPVDVKRGRNGFLVPVGKVGPLAAAMELLSEDPGLGETMGREGRKIAEDIFEVDKVNALMLGTMGIA